MAAASLSIALLSGLTTLAPPVNAAYHPGIPPAVDPGTPTFGGDANPVPPEPVAFDPSTNTLEAIYQADLDAGGTSFWVDRLLARPFRDNSTGERALYTRGRALYMYTHNPGVLGFAGQGTGANGGGGYAYRQPPTTSVVNLYTISLSGGALTETTTERIQYPSYFSSLFTGSGLSVAEKKFITDNDVAVTDLTITNTGTTPTTRTVTATSPIASTASADGSEVTGQLAIRYGLTTIFPRMSGDGFTASGTSLSRSISLDPGASVSLKIQLGAIATEIPASATDYARYRGYSPETAWKTQMAEYNRWWVDNVPYVDYPDPNVKKISWYRTWENRFNMFDGNIPGNDYQFPADLEGALGYNNQISLTVPMRLQDLKFWRDPEWSYGPVLSQGEESGCQAFHDNPGNTGNWNNTYEQWTALEAWRSYLVHGGPPEVVRNLAKYSECDLDGMLAKFDTNHNDLIEYSSGTLPGNDADSVAFKFYGSRPQDRTESSYWYSGARAAAQEYALLGDTAKAAEMNGIADRIKAAILDTLWADGPVDAGSGGPKATGPRVAGVLGNALHLNGSGEYVVLPNGLTTGLTSDYTISVWVNPTENRAWSRIIDFGTGTTFNMFLTAAANGNSVRFAITTGGGGAEQQITRPGLLPTNTWTHLAVTVSGTTGTLFVNGAPAATNPAMTLHPSNLGNTTQNWIGRSQYGDPLLNGTVDDLQIYDRALSAGEIATLAGPPPTQGSGNVLAYRFDETDGPTATDSSGNGRDGTIVSPTVTNSCPGKVFLQRDLTTGNLVCWKDQQNFAPFIDGIPPNTDDYKQALRYYADKTEFPIMPVYTANQADQQQAVQFGTAGSNNFSNINETLQARLYSRVLRDYPSQYVTPDMYRKMIEWLSWNEYVNGDNRFPDNNEFFFNWNPTTQTLGRSGIHHDVLGSFNWTIFEDVAGLQPRLDDAIELYPIDMGLDHFAVNGLSYHGSDLTIVWQRPGGTTWYPQAPMGYSLYVGGRHVATVDDLAHVRWDSASGSVAILDGSSTSVLFHAAAPIKKATDVGLSTNPRVTDSFQKAGVDLYPAAAASHADVNLATGASASASFTTTSPPSQATDPANAVDGFTISGLPVTSGAYVGTDPIWGTRGSPNAQDWLQVDLGRPVTLNTLKLYFYSNKQFGSGGNTYREPAAYTVQFFDGTTWKDAPGQLRTPANPLPNANEVVFRPIVAQQIRLLVTPTAGFGVGVKELQAFNLTPLEAGFWKNHQGQALITAGATTAGTCDSAAWLRQFNPLADLSPTATCAQVASYVSSVIGAAKCAPQCNAMLKSQFLVTALNLFFTDPTIGGASVDLVHTCANPPGCTTVEDASPAFGGAASRTVAHLLADAASQSNPGGTTWYGQVKATQVLAKDVFAAINALAASSP